VDLADGWRRVLEQLSVQERAPFLAARLNLEGSSLILAFAYAFHHQKALECAPRLEPLVAAWLGPGVKVDYRLQDGGGPVAGTSVRPTAPEEHEMVQRAVRQLEGRVTKVSVPKVKESQP
jgi:hypothetical protein